MVGKNEGWRIDPTVGREVVGRNVGPLVGWFVGPNVGIAVGTEVGFNVGVVVVGNGEGRVPVNFVGTAVGVCVVLTTEGLSSLPPATTTPVVVAAPIAPTMTIMIPMSWIVLSLRQRK